MSGQLLMPLIQARNAQAEQHGLLGASPWDTLQATQSPEQIDQMRRAGLLALDYATAMAPIGMTNPRMFRLKSTKVVRDMGNKGTWVVQGVDESGNIWQYQTNFGSKDVGKKTADAAAKRFTGGSFADPEKWMDVTDLYK